MDRRPPDASLSILIAERGENIIPTLLERLELEKDELFQASLIEVFRVMSLKGHLRRRDDVIKRIEAVVGKMKISTYRQMAGEELADIESNSVTPNSQ